jgi:glycosyltransferase involved in cell wall biosynthesis
MKVSVIIPTYNSARFLGRAVKSVLNQSMQDFEIIIVDDASDDETQKVVDLLREYDDRISYKRLETNSGGAARPKNVGIGLAQGSFIGVLDADDEWMPEKLETQLRCFKDSNVDVVGCNTLIVKRGAEKKNRVKVCDNVLHRILESDYMGSGSTMMYRKEVLDAIGGFDETLKTGQDWDMRIRLAQNHRFHFVPGAPLIYYHLHDKNVSHKRMEEKSHDLNAIEQKHRGLYDANPKTFSNKLRSDGTRLVLAGHGAEGRFAFARAIGVNPKNTKAYAFFLISLLGPRIYRSLTQMKRHINSRSI